MVFSMESIYYRECHVGWDLPVMNANSFINFEMAKTYQLSVVLNEV